MSVPDHHSPAAPGADAPSGCARPGFAALESRTLTVRRRQPLYLPGEPARAVYLLKHGRVKISNWASTGKEVTFAILAAGELFGELEALDGIPRQTCAEALDEVVVAAIPRETFLEHLRKHPGAALDLTRLVTLRLRSLHARVEDLAVRDVPARIVHALRDLSAPCNPAPAGSAPVRVRVTHQELANLIGCNRETVSAVLGQFRRRGLVRMERQAITILSPDLVARHVA